VQLLKWRDRWRHYLRSVTNVCISFEITLVCYTINPVTYRSVILQCWSALVYLKGSKVKFKLVQAVRLCTGRRLIEGVEV